MKHLISKVPPFLRNFYFLSTLFFVVWLTMVDSNDLFTQIQLSSKYNALQESKTFYDDKILEVKNEKEALTNNPELLEKLAREKYLMKKANEELYFFVDKDL